MTKPTPSPSAGSVREDTFRGNNKHLVECINALLDLDDADALVPHGVGKGSHAYKLLATAASRLTAAPAPVLVIELDQKENSTCMEGSESNDGQATKSSIE